MRSVLTTAAEILGAWLIVVSGVALANGPTLEVAGLAGGLGLILLGVSEAA